MISLPHSLRTLREDSRAGLVLGVQSVPDGLATGLLAGSGIALLLTDLRAGRIALGELAGAVVLAKLALLVWMALDARQAAWIFWSLLVASSVSSHASKGWRHWPRSRQVRASNASKPG